MAAKLFLHGVPDSPVIWRPLLHALDMDMQHVYTPALPGFDAPLPAGFHPTKDAYVDWLIGQLDDLYRMHGPVDVVGHDWGALIVQRTAMLRPDLIRSWIVCNAVIEPEYRGHRVARIWSTPILGELFMALSRPHHIADTLKKAGVPFDIAAEEGQQWLLKDKRRAILTLYRSAAGLSFADDWARDIPSLPPHGMLLWGENDPYVPLEVARRYIRTADNVLKVVRGAGHWAIVSRPADVAQEIRVFWSSFK